jgi:hypothetical protein
VANSISPIVFVGTQPDPEHPDLTYLVRSSKGDKTYAVTTTTCSCPWGTHNKEHLADHPCRHLAELLRRLDPDTDESLPETKPSSV